MKLETKIKTKLLTKSFILGSMYTDAVGVAWNAVMYKLYGTECS